MRERGVERVAKGFSVVSGEASCLNAAATTTALLTACVTAQGFSGKRVSH